MLAFSSHAGELARRVGPRIPLTVGPLLCAAGMLMMLRVGTHASYVPHILPALVVLGTGMVIMVAPLTVTLLSSVDTTHVGIASGINNAAARASGLIAVATLALLAGMGPDAYRSSEAFDTSYSRAMAICADVTAIGAALAFVTLRETSAVRHRIHWRAHAWLMEPPLAPRISHKGW